LLQDLIELKIKKKTTIKLAKYKLKWAKLL